MTFLDILCAVVFGAYAIKAAIFLVAYRQLLKNGTRAVGKIEIPTRNSWWFPTFPTVSFTTADNRHIVKKPLHSWSGSGSRDYTPGETCTVYYFNTDPSRFVIENNVNVRVNMLMMFLGLLMVGLCIAKLLKWA